jgi:hypothetical protein
MASKDKQTPKEDADIWLASVLFTAVGVGYLFPFSALTQPVDYWHKIFPDYNIEFPLTSLYMWVNLVFLFLIVFFGGEPSYTVRIVGGFIGQLLVLVAVPSFYFLNLDESTHFMAIMTATGLAAIATAFVDSVAISFACQYPLRIQEALQFGIGFSTLIGSIFRVVTKLVYPVDQVVESSLMYFYIGAGTILFCIFAYFHLLSLPISQRCVTFGVSETAVSESVTSTTPTDAEDLQRLLALEENARGGSDGKLLVGESSTVRTVRGNYASYGTVDNTKSATTATTSRSNSSKHPAASDGSVVVVPPTPAAPLDRWALLKKVALGEFYVFLVFFSTLLLWPPLITEIHSFNFPYLEESKWWPLILLTFFSLFDCVGRLSLSYRGWLTASNIWIPVLLRFVLFPLLICSVKGVYFTHDAFSVLFVCALGFTNGYLGSMAILFVNESVADEEKGLVGTFTGFFLNLGLVWGATAAVFMEQWVLQA